MADDSFRRHCWLSAVLGTFGMLLALRGMGLDELLKPDDVRWCLSILLVIGISALLISLFFMHLYTSKKPDQHLVGMEGYPTSGDGSGRSASPSMSSTSVNYGSMDTTSSTHLARADPVIASPSINASCTRSAITRAVVYMDSPTVKHGNISSFLSRHSHVIAVYVFGGGGMVLNICYVSYTSMCVKFFKNGTEQGLIETLQKVHEYTDEYTFGDEVTRLISSLLKLIFFAMQIPYLHFLSTKKFTKCKTASQYLFLPIMGANFAIWLYTFLDETKLIQMFHFPYPSKPYIHNLETACLNHSTVLEVYIRKSLEKVFYPISMEFCLTSMEILYHVYFVPVLVVNTANEVSRVAKHTAVLQHIKELCGTESQNRVRHITMTETPATSHVEEDKEGISESKTIEILIMVPARTPDIPSKSYCHKIALQLVKILHPCTALIFGLIEATLIKIFLLHLDVVEDGYIDITYLTDVFKLPLLIIRVTVNSFLPLITTLCCLYAVKKFPERKKSPRGIKWSLFLGLVGQTLISVFQIAVCAEKIITMNKSEMSNFSEDENKLYILSMVESALCWPEYFSLALLIYHAQRRLSKANHPLYEPLQQALSYLAMKSFMDWGINSFIETDYLRNRVGLVDNAAYWDLLVHLAVPTAVYFRFTCTFLLLDAKHLLSTCHGRNVGRANEEDMELGEELTQWRLSITLAANNVMNEHEITG